jgi:processive 1,2-diacylglycerol beta-glucosyltransferase
LSARSAEAASRPPGARASQRVLILTADVGEGHVAAARAIGEGLNDLGIQPVICDGLAVLGPLPRHVIRDGYRFQLRVAPWMYTATYWLGAHAPPARMLGSWALSVSGRRRMQRLVRCHNPDVIVSTHPAVTCVLGRMRQRRQLEVPVCATITDLADYTFWSHPGVDLHLVAHPRAITHVERFAGSASAAYGGPLVGRGFRQGVEPAEARAALGLPADGRIAVVSGGGWGVGDLAGATEEALAAGATDVVVLAGRNGAAHAALAERFARDARVRVWRFTDRMPELLHAADVLVHSTGGMTSLEAITCGFPFVAYGSTVGHIRIHNRALADLRLALVAETRDQLRDALAARLRTPLREEAAVGRVADAPAMVAQLRGRVQPFGRWRIAVQHAAAVVACVMALFASMADDAAYSVAAGPLDLRPGTTLATSQRAVGLVVRAPTGEAAALARALAARGVRASFALPNPPAASTVRALATLGDDFVPVLGGGPAQWPRTKRALHDAVTVGKWRLYLATAELGFGQYMLAASMHARPIAGNVTLRGNPQAIPSLSPGDLVVVTAPGPAAPSASGVAAFASRLAAERLPPESLSELSLTSATTERTAGDVMSRTAEQVTRTRPVMTPEGPRGA